MQIKAERVILGLSFQGPRETVTNKSDKTLLNKFSDAEIAEVYAAAIKTQTEAHGA
jgi:spore germination protein YaaH